MEQITRGTVIKKLADHLQHRISLAHLVDWAEQVMMDGEFTPADHDLLRDIVARLGVADVREFGLTWEECEALAARLGYRAEVTLRPANGEDPGFGAK